MRIGSGVRSLGLGVVLCAQGLPAQESAPGVTTVGGEPRAIEVPGGGEAAGGAQSGVASRAARLVLLSSGVVRVGRSDVQDNVAAQQNMALSQGSVVQALENGQAEIEFEDGSVVRLTPQSAVVLDSLGQDGGGSSTILRQVRGLVYMELRSSGAARYRVIAGGDTFWPVDNSTVRVNLEEPPAVISVLDGRILVEHATAAAQGIEGFRTDVKAGESVRSDASDASRYFLTESVPPGTWDQWNEQRDQAAANEVAEGTPVREGFAGQQGYGWSDLDANGNWYGAPGQTPVWQPEEALEAGFDPYGYGSWSSFSGVGYVWASGYAWGWTPYRCGNWQFWDGFGWGWQPNALCGSGFRFGMYGVNVGRGPRGYVPVQVPIRRPGGVHPIVPGPHAGESLPFVRGPRQTTEVGSRTIAGVVMAPVRPVGAGYTARGGSAVGSSLRRDFPVDGRTHQALMGRVESAGPVQASTVSAGTNWRAVTTRPETPGREVGGGFLGLFGRGSRQAGEVPVRVDARGNPFSEPARRGADGTGRPVQQGFAPGGAPAGQQRSQPIGGAPGYRGPMNAPQSIHSSAPAMVRSAPPPSAPPMMRSAPPPSGPPPVRSGPAASSPGRK